MVGVVQVSYRDILRTQLRIDEGVWYRPYPDTEGKLTIGVGHNLTDKPLPAEVVDLLFKYDLADAEADARKLVNNFDALSEVRKGVVVNMSFQLGYDRFSAFHDTLAAINENRWGDAADHLLQSKVARDQAPARWARHARQMRSDEL